MATASELLAGMSEVDKTLVIDNNLRVIYIPSSVPNLGVEYDDDVLKLDFRMPRYICDTDLSEFRIRINYINSKGESDVYEVKNPTVRSDHIMFTWLVGPTATRYKGNTKFNICLRIVDSEGIVEKEFNTTIATLPVLEGLEVDEGVVTGYSDIIEQWRQDLFGTTESEVTKITSISAGEQEAIVNTGELVLASIPPDYATAVSMTDNAERTKSDAIVCTKQDRLIRVEDSSDDYLRGLKIFGQTTQISTTGSQLFDASNCEGVGSNSSIIISDDTYTITAVGGTTVGYAFSKFSLNLDRADYADKTLVMEADSITGQSQCAVMIYGFINGENALSYTLKPGNTSINCPISSDIEELKVYVYTNFTGTVTTSNNTITIHGLRVGYETGPWEPYSAGIATPSPEWPQAMNDIENPTIDVCSSNIAVQRFKVDLISNGIHIVTSNTEPETLLDGEADKLFSYTVLRTDTLPPGTYTISASGVNIHDSGHDRIYVMDHRTGKVYANYIRDGSPKTITLSSATELRLDMVFKEYSLYENRILKIQIEAGDKATEYERCGAIQSIATNHTLSGIPTSKNGNYTDKYNRQWVCDEIDFDRGVYIQRIATVTLDGVNIRPYVASHSNGQLYAAIYPTDIAYNSVVMSDQYGFSSLNWTDKNRELYGIGGAIIINDDEFTDANVVKDIFADRLPKIKYVLAKPIETPLTAAEIAAFRFAHTNFQGTTVLNNYDAPMELVYNADTKTWFENLPKANDDQVRAAVDAWLEAHYPAAEGARF